MVKKLFTLFLLLSINIGFANVGLAQIASVEASARPQPTDQEIKNQCALIGNLTFLAIEKFKKGRELDQAKDELSRVAETAFNKEEFAAFSDQLRERYNAAVLMHFYRIDQIQKLRLKSKSKIVSGGIYRTFLIFGLKNF